MIETDYCEDITQPRRRRVLIVGLATAACAVAIAAWRLRSGLALIGDSGSYLAGASGLTQGRFFETPLVPSFSELPLLDTVSNAGWSPYADFGIGLPLVIALFDIAFPLTTAAELVAVLSIGAIVLGVVIGPWWPATHKELVLRSALGIALSCWPIMRFTSVGVLSEPLFCALLIWLVVTIARMPPDRTKWLVGIGLITVCVGTLRFVGPVVAVAVAVLLYQRGIRLRTCVVWGTLTALGPLLATITAAGSTGARAIAIHSIDATDVFFTARGVGGWFDAELGNQTTTLLRTNFQPDLVDWLITASAVIAGLVVVWSWITRIRQRSSTHLESARVLAVVLALAVVPSMVFLDAVVKLENRILMPSGLLVLSSVGWWITRNIRSSFGWPIVLGWTIVATQPWNWLDRPAPPTATGLTDAVVDIDPTYVITDQADLVWWITRVPARYLPDGYHALSDRNYDSLAIMTELPCALSRTDGMIIVDTSVLAPSTSDQLDREVAAGDYEKREMTNGVAAFVPTGRGC